MSSVMRFDEWQDSNGVPVLNGTGGGLALGKILQVVSASSSTETTTTSTSYQPSGLEATITPSSADSKIMVFCFGSFQVSDGTNNQRMFTRVTRGATQITEVRQFVNGSGVTTKYNIGSVTHAVLDSPSTTSATTYKYEFKSEIGTAMVQADGRTSFMTLMEVAD